TPRRGRRGRPPAPPPSARPARPSPVATAAPACGGSDGGTAPPRAGRAAPPARGAGRAGDGRAGRAAPSPPPPAPPLLAQRPPAARAQGEDAVAVADLLGQPFRRGLDVAGVDDLAVAAGGDRPGERLRADVRDGLLARGVHVGQEQDVGLVEGAAELVPQELRPRVAVGLEEDERAAVARPRPQRLERRA